MRPFHTHGQFTATIKQTLLLFVPLNLFRSVLPLKMGL